MLFLDRKSTKQRFPSLFNALYYNGYHFAQLAIATAPCGYLNDGHLLQIACGRCPSVMFMLGSLYAAYFVFN